MKRKCILQGVVISLCLNCLVFADRTLNRAEILDVFQKLTDQPRKTWIPSGTIEAVQDKYKAAKITDQDQIDSQISQEIKEYQNNTNKRELTPELQEMKLEAIPFNVRYRLSNEYSMNSYMVIKYDGSRFFWEIDVNSRTDSVTLPAELKGNFMTEQFNMDWNAGRTFVWDGQKYAFYCLPINQAYIDTTNSFPLEARGPLTAGIVPWGYGYLSYDNLSASQATAVEVVVDGRTEIHLTINFSDGTEMLFILEPAKNYAVLSHLITSRDSVVAKQYDDFRLISGNWVPMSMLIEKYDHSTNKLLASDFWKFISISDAVPSSDSFQVNFKPGALVSYNSSSSGKPFMYQYADGIDIAQPLARSLALATSDGSSLQNCATAAVGYAVRQLGKKITDQQLAPLLSGPSKTTNLQEMKQFVQGLGFYSRVVRTNLETLRNLSGCRAILHIPAKNHFVLFDHVDDQYVWILDLTSRKFFYRTDIDLFRRDWTEGTALLVSKQPIEIRDSSTEIADAKLDDFVGASGYTCTKLLQEDGTIYCDYIGGMCVGYYERFFERWGCEAAGSGSCSNSNLLSHISTPCIDDLYLPFTCTVEWQLTTFYYMRACQ
jgi:hypothetical protein